MAALWGAAFVGVRHVAQFVGPFNRCGYKVFYRYHCTGLCHESMARFADIIGISVGRALLLGATGVFAYNALFFVGMKNGRSRPWRAGYCHQSSRCRRLRRAIHGRIFL